MATTMGLKALLGRKPRLPDRCKGDEIVLIAAADMIASSLSAALQVDAMVRCTGVSRPHSTIETTDTYRGVIAGDGRELSFEIGADAAASLAQAVFGSAVDGPIVDRVAQAVLRTALTPASKLLGAVVDAAEARPLRADYEATWIADGTERTASFVALCPVANSDRIADTPQFQKIRVQADAHLGSATSTVAEIRDLSPGTVIKLDDGGLEAVTMQVCGNIVARGELGRSNGRQAIRLVQVA